MPGGAEGEVTEDADSSMQLSSTLTPISAAWAIADPVGMEDPEVSDPEILLMLIGFEGEDMAVDSVGLATDGDEEDSDVFDSSPTVFWASLGTLLVGMG